MKTIDRNAFTQTTIEAIGYYVYSLIDPRNGETFYVGKGVGNRVFMHVQDSLKTPHSTDKLDRIREIHDEGYEVTHLIIRHGMTEDQAFEVEAAIIDMTPNLTNLVKGHGSIRGPKSIKQINEMYDAEIADIDGLKVLMIKINNSYGKMDPIDATCFSWKISAEKMMKADVILGVANGIIRTVLEPRGWNFSNPIQHGEMWEHYGFDHMDQEQRKRKVIKAIPADILLHERLIGKAIPAEYSMKGSQQALRYNY
ncbi:putative homing nuclease [Pseudomonas phage OBP]|uniref:putative homing nuclease n=1 Tax=Pseudomonas phage OBP TaxID=1124849 RepID=UPI000240D585|nr:putative homing nuclease [Pseudomonas phage OBP]AEV89602.1 putative homing nuclease [Pseudomonas phage OBP]